MTCTFTNSISRAHAHNQGDEKAHCETLDALHKGDICVVGVTLIASDVLGVSSDAGTLAGWAALSVVLGAGSASLSIPLFVIAGTVALIALGLLGVSSKSGKYESPYR